MKLRILVFSFVLLTVLPVFAVKIAAVDMKRVWESSNEIKVEKKNMEAMLQKSQKELEAKEKELMALQERAKREAAIATEEAKRAMAEEYQRKMMELQQLYNERQKDLQDKDVKAQGDFIEKVKRIAMRIAIQKGYDVVLAKEQVLYIDDKYDITKDVIAEVNK
jgi:outer membrane protein